jgi:hypothetical protein
VAPEHIVTIVVVGEQCCDVVLGARVEQQLLHRTATSTDLASIDVVIARHQQQTIARQTGGQCRPELAVEPTPGQGVLLGASGKCQVAADDHEVRRQPPSTSSLTKRARARSTGSASQAFADLK